MSAPGLEPTAANNYRSEHAALLIRSYRQLTGRDLLPAAPDPKELAYMLYRAPFVVLSHNGDSDPVFTYANLAAQRLFAMPWQEIVGMPSRYSAEAPARDERQHLLDRVAQHGYIDDYQGIRIAKTGERFLISNATVWNLGDDAGRKIGQAATFSEWELLPTSGVSRTNG